jgi:hypothetical protein
MTQNNNPTISSLWPTSFKPPQLPLAFYLIIYNYLEREIEKNPELRLPLLAQMYGWRSREVHDHIHAQMAEIWDKRIALEMYGTPGALV